MLKSWIIRVSVLSLLGVVAALCMGRGDVLANNVNPDPEKCTHGTVEKPEDKACVVEASKTTILVGDANPITKREPGYHHEVKESCPKCSVPLSYQKVEHTIYEEVDVNTPGEYIISCVECELLAIISVIAKCEYRASGVDDNGNPEGASAYIVDDQNVKPYNIDCVVTSESTISDVFDAVSAAAKKLGMTDGTQGVFVGDVEGPHLGFGEGTIIDNGECPICGRKTVRRCQWPAVLDVRATYYIQVPKWNQVAAAGEKAKREWNRYSQALMAHEIGHKNIFEEYLSQVKSLVKAYEKKVIWAESCTADQSTDIHKMLNDKTDAVEAIFNGLADQIEKSYDQKDMEYESQTDHGRTQSNLGGEDIDVDYDAPLGE